MNMEQKEQAVGSTEILIQKIFVTIVGLLILGFLLFLTYFYATGFAKNKLYGLSFENIYIYYDIIQIIYLLPFFLIFYYSYKSISATFKFDAKKSKILFMTVYGTIYIFLVYMIYSITIVYGYLS
jgi:hypothetical protein